MIKRILIDTNALTIQDGETGIQRVIKKIITNLTEKCVNVEVIAFNNHTGKCTVSKELMDSLIPNNKFQLNQEIVLKSGDYILNADMLPGVWKGYFKFYIDAKDLGIPVTWVCHDLIPYYYPHFWENHVSIEFMEMVDIFFNHIADDIICVSKTVADEHVLKYFEQTQKPYPNISYWHLGSDFKTPSQNKLTTIPSIKDKEYLLMVGTIEPRKNHKLALTAMEKLWETGSDLCLVMVGRIGWLSDEMINIIQNHPQLNKKFFYFGHVSDDELIYCYKNCKALLQLSTSEGFGLPVIEASYYGAEIICSDISIFREVAGDYANYVSLNPIELSKQLQKWYKSGMTIDSKNMSKLSWSDSCDNLMDIIFNGHVYAHATKEKQNYNTFHSELNTNKVYVNWLNTHASNKPFETNTAPVESETNTAPVEIKNLVLSAENKKQKLINLRKRILNL